MNEDYKPTSKEMEQRLYSMKIGEIYSVYNCVYLRVPGGWVLTIALKYPVFIPFTKEIL